MDDKEACLAELERLFRHPDCRFDLVDHWVAKYEAASDLGERDGILRGLWNWMLSEQWAFDIFMELCRRAELNPNQPRLLDNFAKLVAPGKLKPPSAKPGHPRNDASADMEILATVNVLRKYYGFTKTAAYERVSAWSKSPGKGCNALEPGGIRKLVGRTKKKRPFPRSKMSRK